MHRDLKKFLRSQIMKLTRRAGLVGITLSAAAILATTATLATTAASAAPTTPAIHRCTSGNTRVWLGSPGDGFAGGIAWQIEISNIGHHACTLFGYPGVSVVNGSGHQVGLPAAHAGHVTTVTIQPGGTSHVVLIVHDAGIVCPGHEVHGSSLRVFAPNQFNSELTPLSVAVCRHKVNMDVDAVHPNAGIPGFTAA
jgi:hypothetical protein